MKGEFCNNWLLNRGHSCLKRRWISRHWMFPVEDGWSVSCVMEDIPPLEAFQEIRRITLTTGTVPDPKCGKWQVCTLGSVKFSKTMLGIVLWPSWDDTLSQGYHTDIWHPHNSRCPHSFPESFNITLLAWLLFLGSQRMAPYNLEVAEFSV